MLTLPHYMENKASFIRERLDFKIMSLDKLYEKLKTREIEQEHRAIIYGSDTADNKNKVMLQSTRLVAKYYKNPEVELRRVPTIKDSNIEIDITENEEAINDSDFYTLEELKQLEDATMAELPSKFSQL